MTHARTLILLLLALLLTSCSTATATITWETASEVNTAGFNIYRSNSPEGPWQKINQQLIPPSEDPVGGGSYKFVDTQAQPGQTYYYQLEEIELSGSSTQFDPIPLQTHQTPPAWLWWGAAIVSVAALTWLGVGKAIRTK
jgi:hypothetical protein